MSLFRRARGDRDSTGAFWFQYDRALLNVQRLFLSCVAGMLTRTMADPF